jgi:hypothetical protein
VKGLYPTAKAGGVYALYSKTAKKELETLARRLGISQKAVLEIAIREKAEREAQKQ